MIYALLQQLQALGLNVPDLLKQIGTSNDVDGVKVATEKQQKKNENQHNPSTDYAEQSV